MVKSMVDRFAGDLVVDFCVDEYEASRLSACGYCGSTVSITRDHVIPSSWARESRSYRDGDTIRCCRECNSVLSDIALFSVESRANYLISEYIRRYDAAIRTPNWSDEELAELDYSLRAKVESARFEKEFIMRRLSHLTQVVGSGDAINVRQ